MCLISIVLYDKLYRRAVHFLKDEAGAGPGPDLQNWGRTGPAGKKPDVFESVLIILRSLIFSCFRCDYENGSCH